MPTPVVSAASTPLPDVTLLVVGAPALPLDMLRQSGVQVTVVASVDEALAVRGADDLALIVLGESMPIAVAERLRGSRPTRQVPLLFMRDSASCESLPSFAGDDAAPVDVVSATVDARLLRHKIAVFVERHRQRLALGDQAAALQRVTVFDDAMVSVLVHDLLSPLTAIAASAELVCRTATGELPREAGERIKRSSQRMARDLSQLLDLARIRSGGLQLDCAPGDLGDVVARAMAEARQSIPSARIDHRAEGDLRGRFDADRLVRVVVHLLSNALLHGAPGQPVSISIDGSMPAELSVRVVNTGCLPPDRQPSAFGLAPTLSPGGTRLRLGLYVVEHVVLAHGGRVTGRSVEDGSTVFDLSIPRSA